jgi:iron transport multicopper oxidase
LVNSFTARGIVALVFSCISGILGVAVVAWYGFADVKQETYTEAQHRIDEAGGVDAAGSEAGAGKTEAVEEITATSGSSGIRHG